MMKPEYTETLRGYTIEIHQDEDPFFSPKENADKHAFLVYGHRDFTVYGPNNEKAQDIHNNLDEWKETYHVWPVYTYIHSGVYLKLGSDEGLPDRQWDVSMCGYVLITKDESEIPYPEKYAQGMIEEWNQYLSGDVWGFVIKAGEEEIRSCWGFYGLDYCKEEARSEAPDKPYCPHKNVDWEPIQVDFTNKQVEQFGTCQDCKNYVHAYYGRGEVEDATI